MQTWALGHSNEGFTIGLYEHKWWALAIEDVTFWLMDKTAGFGTYHSELLWKISVGFPKYELSDPADSWSDRWLANSVGSLIHNIEQGILRWAWKGEKQLKKIPITRDEAEALGWDCWYMDDDDDE